jgi:RNA 2',3'-cyclic 3'-phosphodiesterase
VRAFVAVEVEPPEEVVALRRAPEHLTLDFLGEVDAAQVPAIVTALEPLGDAVAPFELVLEGIGAFPSPSRPRVVWVGATEGRAEVVDLARRVAAALVPLGFTPPREAFEPHLTLFRVRSDRDRRRAIDLLEGRTPPPARRRIAVDRFVLKESVLEARGAIHRTLAPVRLRGPPAPANSP